jgi:uncharacterized protein (TIGR04255 family)
MSAFAGPRPDFARPPVIEVALSIQFDPLQEFRIPHIGLLWQSFRMNFPRTELHPPRDPVFEIFGVPKQPSINVRVERIFPVPQVRFINERGSELIQVQQDRFVHNWRKTEAADDYPRYPYVRNRFLEELNTFCCFLSSENLGELLPNQCEVTYVNHIRSGQGWHSHGEAGRIFTAWTGGYSDTFLGEPQDVAGRMRFAIPGATDVPVGRLLVSMDPGFVATDDSPMYAMTLTARGKPLGEGIEGAFAFLDLGREWVVRGFASLTTPEMHRIWGRRDAGSGSA